MNNKLEQQRCSIGDRTGPKGGYSMKGDSVDKAFSLASKGNSSVDVSKLNSVERALYELTGKLPKGVK